MAELYLITGFLGAGKTTFLKNFARLFSGKQLRLIVNEFGREGVDGALLRELDAALSEINNGSIFCTCRLDQFEAALKEISSDPPDVILVETSGLADPTNVRRVLEHFPQIDYQGSICLVDAQRLKKVFSTALVCPRQLSVSSLVLLNKTDLATESQCEEAEQLIYQANPAATIKRTAFAAIEEAWLGYLVPDISLDAALNKPDITLQKAILTLSDAMPRDKLEKCLAFLSSESWRIKGFVHLCGGTYHVDSTGTTVSLRPWEGAADNRLVLLAGKGMALRKTVKTATQLYGDYIRGFEL